MGSRKVEEYNRETDEVSVDGERMKFDYALLHLGYSELEQLAHLLDVSHDEERYARTIERLRQEECVFLSYDAGIVIQGRRYSKASALDPEFLGSLSLGHLQALRRGCVRTNSVGLLKPIDIELERRKNKAKAS